MTTTKKVKAVKAWTGKDKVVGKQIKPVYSIATVRNGKINWVAQNLYPVSNIELKHWAKCFKCKVIRVEIREIK